ncbi:MAG: CusA/CzcA family heavy metal efflux RND transporter [Acidobacteriaceae bacterium]|nr:CusA/CzcA family heavy metal efflux RND transporter [Acidobacteriaceae bacterium]
MIEWIIEFSIRHKLAIILAVAAASAFGWWSIEHTRLDALPELGDTQVIIFSRWNRSPDLVEAQVTYPIVTAMLGAPHVKTVRGVSDFGYSYVYVIFDDNTDLYWARSRTLEYLAGVLGRLPEGVKTELGPDATSLGWVFQYALVDSTGQHSLSELRSYQDWNLHYRLTSVPGVADVAPVGGFTRQYQVNVDPDRLRAYGITITQVVNAVREGNNESSARMLDFGGTEYMIRGRGYAASSDDFGNIAVTTTQDGSVIRVRDLGDVVEGPDLRRGVADLDGAGDVVSGIVLMRGGENALEVIDRVKARLKEIQPGLPSGVKIVPIYDRSELIHRTIDSTKQTILEVVITVALIVLVFLWHFPSASIPLVTMPAAVLLSFIPFRLMGVSVNVMSLAGIAIAFGELIDASIVVVEQTHKKLEQWEKEGSRGSRSDVVLSAVKEVTRPTFFALLVIAVSFLPLWTLEGEQGRLFRPLVYTKTLAMVAAAVLAITFDPALRLLLTRVSRFHFRPAWLCKLVNSLLVGRIRPEESNWISRSLMRIYEPAVLWTLHHKWVIFTGAAVLIVATVPVFLSLGSEFMPPMDEGAILYMPTSAPGISIAQARQVLQTTDMALKQFPEVDRVLGKAGRAETATDPAPLSMIETLITLKPRSEWRHVPTWYSAWAPEWVKSALRHITPDTISSEELINQMNSVLKVPGLSNAWTMPIRGRVDMLTSGIRTPVGLKISGDDPAEIQKIGEQVTAVLPSIRGTRGVFSERTNEGHFLDVAWRRDELARYGISIDTAEEVLTNAAGGDNVSTAYQGLARYPVNVRYMRDFRSSADALGRILVPAGGQRQIPIGELATITCEDGPAMIRDEDGMLTGYVYIDLTGRDAGSYVAEAARALKDKMKLPAGYAISWEGQSEEIMRANRRLQIIVPVTLGIVILLILMSTRSVMKTVIVLLAVPFSAIGAVWSIYLLHYNMSVAVWVGIIALLSIDAETGVFMLLYLDLAFEESMKCGTLRTLADLRRVIRYGAAKRLRPKFMTFATTCIGLIPVMWSIGTGSEVMKRIAAPLVGGIFTSFMLELLVYPVIYELWKRSSVAKNDEQADAAEAANEKHGQELAVAMSN